MIGLGVGFNIKALGLIALVALGAAAGFYVKGQRAERARVAAIQIETLKERERKLSANVELSAAAASEAIRRANENRARADEFERKLQDVPAPKETASSAPSKVVVVRACDLSPNELASLRKITIGRSTAKDSNGLLRQNTLP